MTTRELKAWIGRAIEWDSRPDARGWYTTRRGHLEDVAGRNVLVSNTWYWFPDMLNIRLIQPVDEKET